MDGTLLDDNHLISEENKKALKEAQNRGVVIAVTTGRLFVSASYYYSILGIEGPIIASNGAYIRENSSAEFIYKYNLSLLDTKQLNEILNKTSLTHYFYTYNTAITSKAFPANHPYVLSNEDMPEHLKILFNVQEDIEPLLKEYENDILKVYVTCENDTETLFKVKDEIKEIGKYEVVSSGNNNFEIMKKGASKGLAVKILAESLNIKQEEVMCIGDNENDLSMIKYAGLGVAMGNGVNILKNEANYITDTNLNSGVAKVIQKFVLD